ncbi:transcriptional regulator GutM [Escherichia marmotae]|nr:transcriptional regulator GutM [Escherichia marmotae]
MVSALITVAVIAWCTQLALGGWQISRFNRAFDALCQQGRVGVGRAFDALCQQGRVGVGRSSGRFKPRVVVAIALDDQQRIVDTLFMKGLTVFARPQKIPAITGMHSADLRPDVIFPHDPLSQNALSLALKLKRR